MAVREQSLLSYLTQRNPILTQKCPDGSNTKSYRQMWKEPAFIREWKDFRPESLTGMYKGQLKRILDTETLVSHQIDIPRVPFCEIYDEDSLEGLLIRWTQTTVSNALVVAQDHLESICASGRIYMARGGQAEALIAQPKDDKRQRSHPDWAAVKVLENRPETGPKATKIQKASKSQKANKMPKPDNILPGDTKVSSKWKSSSIKMGNRDVYNTKPDLTRPVIQVYNYCLKANARYGYIITDEELVVLRIRAKEKADGRGDSQKSMENSQGSQEFYASEEQKQARKRGEVELMSIPWENHVTEEHAVDSTLTVNLALWWLHIMAAADYRIGRQYPNLLEEELPQANASKNVSFTAKLANIDLAPFSHDAESVQVRKKRKADHALQSTVKSARSQ